MRRGYALPDRSRCTDIYIWTRTIFLILLEMGWGFGVGWCRRQNPELCRWPDVVESLWYRDRLQIRIGFSSVYLARICLQLPRTAEFCANDFFLSLFIFIVLIIHHEARHCCHSCHRCCRLRPHLPGVRK